MNGGQISYACRRLWYVRRISDSGQHSDGGAAGESTRIEASGRSGGVLLVWNKGHFELLSSWSGRHLTAARLAVRADGSQQTVVSAYGPCVAQRRGELGENISQLCSLFTGVPILIGGDLNVTIAQEDHPYGMGDAILDLCDSGTSLISSAFKRWGRQIGASHGEALQHSPG